MIKKYSFAREVFKLICIEILMVLDAMEAYFMWHELHFPVMGWKLLEALFFTGGTAYLAYLGYWLFGSFLSNYNIIKRLMD